MGGVGALVSKEISMKIFISWSGDASKIIAKALDNFIPNVIQAIDTFLSSDDIKSGSRWSTEIGGHLEKTDYGILCLTPNNLSEPWILFEAGALSKLGHAHVVPLLLDINPTDIKGPLSQFQAKKLTEKDDIKKFIKDINEIVKDKDERFQPDNKLDNSFDKYWPELEIEINKAIYALKNEGTDEAPTRTDKELLQEILSLNRSFSSQINNIESELNSMKLYRALDRVTGTSSPSSGGLMSGVIMPRSTSGYSGVMGSANSKKDEKK